MYRMRQPSSRLSKGYVTKMFICVILLMFGGLTLIGRITANERGEKYQGIELTQIHCEIPRTYWHPQKDVSYAADHMFCIYEKNLEYAAYGCELDKLGENEDLYGLIKNRDGLDELLNARSEESVRNGIYASIGMLNNVTGQYKIEKPSYTAYSFSSLEQINNEEYQVYIIYFVQNDVRFLQILLERAPGSLTAEDKKQMLLYTYLH